MKIYVYNKLPFETQVLNLLASSTQDTITVSQDCLILETLDRAKGFDGVEIHSAHGYLLNQFYSPLTNKLTDEYSSSNMNNRLRLHLEIINSVRKAVGEDYPIALRLGVQKGCLMLCIKKYNRKNCLTLCQTVSSAVFLIKQ